MAEKFLTVDEIAEYLFLSRATLYQWASEKRIPHYRMGRAIRFKRAEIEALLLDKCKQEPISIEERAEKIIRKPYRDIDVNMIVKKALANRAVMKRSRQLLQSIDHFSDTDTKQEGRFRSVKRKSLMEWGVMSLKEFVKDRTEMRKWRFECQETLSVK